MISSIGFQRLVAVHCEIVVTHSIFKLRKESKPTFIGFNSLNSIVSSVWSILERFSGFFFCLRVEVDFFSF